MKVTVTRYGGGSCSFDDFVDKHQLELLIGERSLVYGLSRYFARFDHIEIKDGSMLMSASGNGDTPQDAIDALAKEIAGRRLVFDAYGSGRREFEAPNEWTNTMIQLSPAP